MNCCWSIAKSIFPSLTAVSTSGAQVEGREVDGAAGGRDGCEGRLRDGRAEGQDAVDRRVGLEGRGHLGLHVGRVGDAAREDRALLGAGRGP